MRAAPRRQNTIAPRAHGMILRVNRFLEWIGLKQKLHQGTQSPPLVPAGDIWWASVGENVGSENNGNPSSAFAAAIHRETDGALTRELRDMIPKLRPAGSFVLPARAWAVAGIVGH